MKRIVGVNYENGEVIGLTVDGLNDETDSAYFKRVYIYSLLDRGLSVFDLYKMRSKNRYEQ